MSQSDPGFAERGGSEFLFDFDTFERMAQARLFPPVGPRVELIEGRLLNMAPISGDHGEVSGEAYSALKTAIRAAGLGANLKVIVHATLKIGEHSAPEPDVFVARPKGARKYYEDHDAVLVVEVSISTRDNDLTIKGPLYARASIPEFWMIEPDRRRLSVLRGPQPDGTWASTTVLEGDATAVSPLFAPQISIPLSELF